VRGSGTRTRREIAAFFGDMRLVAPGLTEAWAWRPDPGAVTVHAGALTVLGGTSRLEPIP
jgi:S-adenosyl methyltransferase